MTNSPSAHLSSSQLTTLGLLFAGYVGYYFCRSNLAVLTPQLILDQPDALSKERIGVIVTVGIIAYLVGKLTTGPVCDFLDGKRMFVAGMIISSLFTIGISFSVGFVPLLLLWIGNRYAQSIGWSGLVKVASRWFPAARYGLIMGILSLSYQFGDSLAKLCLGALLELGLTGREVFQCSALILAAIAAVTWMALRSTPLELGQQEPEVNPENVYGASGSDSRPAGLWQLIRPLLSNPTFWLICSMCAGLTFLRETLIFWTPDYLKSTFDLTTGKAAKYSSILPLAGGAAAVLIGFGTDRWFAKRRSTILAVCLATLTCLLLFMATVGHRLELAAQIGTLSAIFFFMVGPYSTLGGAIALDLGARRGGATTAGLVDSAGYGFGSASGAIAGMFARNSNWSGL